MCIYTLYIDVLHSHANVHSLVTFNLQDLQDLQEKPARAGKAPLVHLGPLVQRDPLVRMARGYQLVVRSDVHRM